MENLQKSSLKLNLFEWARKLNRSLILDGAIGTLLQSEFPDLYAPGVWMNSALINQPEFLQKLYLNYINAGADIITTFTYRTSPYELRVYDKGKHKTEDLVKIAVEQCLEARNKASHTTKPILIAGSNATMSHSYYGDLKGIKDEEIYENHKTHIDCLLKAGVDFILNETFSQLNEIEIVCKMCHAENIPYVVSLYCQDDLKLLSGENLSEAIEIIKKYNPMAISFNCVKYSTMKKILKEIDLKELLWGCYINCGEEKMQEKYAVMGEKVVLSILENAVTPDDLKNFIQEIIETYKLKPCFIGSCCCSNHEHTKKLKELFDQK